MSTYPGPWIQAPDYEAVGYDAKVSASPYGDAIAYETEASLDSAPTAAFDPWTTDDLKPMVLGSHLGTRVTSAETAPGVPEGHVQIDVNYSPSGITMFDRDAHVWRSWRISSISAESLGVRYWAPTPFVGITPPPDAIGWQWEDGTIGDSKKSQIVALNVDWEADTDSSTDADLGPIPEALVFASIIEESSGRYLSDDRELDVTEADFLTEWFGGGGGGAGTAIRIIPGPVSSPVGDSINLTRRLDSAGRLVLASTVTFDPDVVTGPIYPGLVLEGDVVGSPSPSDSIRYGHNIVYTPRWKLHPPVFRWLYPTPQITSAPPLRHTQRDDRHGPSPRNRPARSRQAGHRNTGYL